MRILFIYSFKNMILIVMILLNIILKLKSLLLTTISYVLMLTIENLGLKLIRGKKGYRSVILLLRII